VKFLPPLILLLGSVGCAQRGAPAESAWVPTPAPDLGTVVAQVGSVPIYSSEVAAEALRSNCTAREALSALISLHVLAEQAHQTERFLPDWSDPELRSALAQRLLDRDILPKLRRESVPEQEVQALYQRGINAFVHPRLVEVGLLAIFTGPMMKEGPRAERTKTAKALAAYVATRRTQSPEDFEAIAKEPRWQDRYVTFGKTVPWPDPAFSRKLKDEVLKLKAPGDTTALIEDETGFYLATYAGETPAKNIPYAEVREKLLQGYFERWHAQRLGQIVHKLSEGHRVESHPQLLKL
jgi:hypothetical protein